MNKIIIPPTFVLLSFILIVSFYFIFPSYNLVPFPFNFAGIVISFGGFVIMGKSRDLFKKYDTTLDIKESAVLITDGIFAKTRNPMYLGMFFLLFGFSICSMNLFSIITSLLFLSMMNFYFIPKEEKMLEAKFTEDYIDYRNKIRRWF